VPEPRSPADLAALPGRLAAEDRALLCCARTTLDRECRAELVALAERGLDYASLTLEASRHGLTPLVYRHLGAELGERCPPVTMAELGAATRTCVAKGLALCAELSDLLPLAAARGLDCRVVKGPVAGVLCYGDVGLREFMDLDLLVHEADVPVLSELLAARGYVPHLGLGRTQQRWLLRTDSELMWRHPDQLRKVDVHWSLLPRGYSFTPDERGPFAARSTVPIGGLHVPTLGTEATLLFLLLHGMKHDFAALGWLCDIAELVRRTPGLDWDAVAGWSAPAGLRRFVDIGLALVHALLQAPVPEALLARGRADPAVAAFACEIGRSLFRRERPEPSALAGAFGLAYFRAMARPADRLRYVHDTLLRPTSHEWLALPLPERLRPLYYLVRPARLVARQLRTRGR